MIFDSFFGMIIHNSYSVLHKGGQIPKIQLFVFADMILKVKRVVFNE